MEIVYERCAGLDVHKKTAVACRITREADGSWQQATRTFKTITSDLMADWLRTAGVTHVAMESTGVYWKPVYNILESEFTVLLVNAKHIKYVPGRKTDVKDAGWIAELLQQGLLKASFVPAAPQRALRDLVRYRTALIQERSREINRVQKVLEDANLKLSSVASDVMGVSARNMLAQIIQGQEDPQSLAELAKERMRSKMARFPTAAHAASWAGLAPGKNESAGHNRSAKTPKGNAHLKALLVQAAHTVARSNDNYLGTQFRRLAARRGIKRAAVAVAHSILIIAYHLLCDGTHYLELGADYFEKRNQHYLEQHLVKRLERLGHKVTLEPLAA